MKYNRLKGKKEKKSVSVSNINHTINLKGRIIRWGISKSFKKLLIQVCTRAEEYKRRLLFSKNDFYFYTLFKLYFMLTFIWNKTKKNEHGFKTKWVVVQNSALHVFVISLYLRGKCLFFFFILTSISTSIYARL